MVSRLMKISAHFSRSEFACKCGCGFDTADTELLEVLEQVRQYFMTPVTITSGCRCHRHNSAVGGSQNSQHLYGRAADIKVKDHDPQEVYNFIDKLYGDKVSLGLYSRWVHIDTRTVSGMRW